MNKQDKKATTKIMVAINISHASGRDMLSGIFKFLEKNAKWQMHLVQYSEDFTSELISSAADKGFSGIIATFPCSNDALEALAATPLPTVLVNLQSSILSKRTAPTADIHNDNEAIGRKAATVYLKNGNYASYACVSKSEETWYLERCDGFKKTLELNGKFCKQFILQSSSAETDKKTHSLELFLSELPKPTAIYASSDECAVKILDAANTLKIKTPEQIAIMGTDNDEFLVCHANPPISSIIPGHAAMGMRAANEIKKLISGESSPEERIFIAPVGIAERSSTKPVLPATSLVQRIRKYIENNKSEHFGVSDIANHIGVSRRLAELRFRQLEGKTIHQAIESARLNEAKRLLRKTSYSISEIAKRSGFSGQNRFSHLFKERFGMSPKIWRIKQD
jgi:LacI family transcriptional regulator